MAALHKVNPYAARSTLSTISLTFKNLTDHPYLGRKTQKRPNRRLPIPGTVYIVYYRVSEQNVVILHVRDGRRRPVRM